MKNLLGKFHAELSQQRLASRAKPSQAEPSQAKPSQVCLPRLTTAYHGLPLLTTAYHGLFIFYLSGKFHEKFVRKISCRAKPTRASEPSQAKFAYLFFYLSGKFH